MNEVTNWTFGETEVRTIEIDGETWWVLSDVCKVLELNSPHKVADRIEEDERNQIPVTDSIGRQQLTTIINESGLYSVILRSDKPQAKPFRKWVTGEVLPTIRKYGSYSIQKDSYMIDDPVKRAQRWIEEQQVLRGQIKALEVKAEEDKPKVLFADAVSASKTSILIGELAKLLKQNGYDTGQKRLFQWMRENGYLIKGGSSKNMPTQRSMNMGLFEIKETIVAHTDHTTVNKTVKVTGKGQQYFINLFLDDDSE